MDLRRPDKQNRVEEGERKKGTVKTTTEMLEPEQSRFSLSGSDLATPVACDEVRSAERRDVRLALERYAAALEGVLGVPA